MGGASAVPDWLSAPPALGLPTPAESIEPAAETAGAPAPEANVEQAIASEASPSEPTTTEPPVAEVPESSEPAVPPPAAAEVESQIGESAETSPAAEAASAADTPSATTEPAAEAESIGADTSFMPPEEPFEDELAEAETEEDDAVDPALFGGAPLGGAASVARAFGSEERAMAPPAGVGAMSSEGESAATFASREARERIAARIQGRPSGGMRNIVGLVLFSGLGLFIPYYGLSLISPSFNVLGITWLPGVKVAVRQSSVSTNRERPLPAPSTSGSDSKWPGFAPAAPAKKK
jgi:hypothetical protein